MRQDVEHKIVVNGLTTLQHYMTILYMKSKALLMMAVIVIFVLIFIYIVNARGDSTNETPLTEEVPISNEPSADISTDDTNKTEVDPANVDPSLFVTSTTIDNKYFKLPVGKKLVYGGDTADGGYEKVEITIPGETREILGVKTLVYLDKVWLSDELVEETKDYLAQDIYGNVWYFGEDVNNYENGKLLDHEGAWIAGVDGAEPGIWIKANHIAGDSYKQEYYKGQAEDMRDVSSIGEPVNIKLGSYNDCVKMYDWTPLDPESQEYKHYCSEVGAMVLETKPNTDERLELISAN